LDRRIASTPKLFATTERTVQLRTLAGARPFVAVAPHFTNPATAASTVSAERLPDKRRLDSVTRSGLPVRSHGTPVDEHRLRRTRVRAATMSDRPRMVLARAVDPAIDVASDRPAATAPGRPSVAPRHLPLAPIAIGHRGDSPANVATQPLVRPDEATRGTRTGPPVALAPRVDRRDDGALNLVAPNAPETSRTVAMPAEAGPIDVDDLVARVSRTLLRRFVIERERRGLDSWL
jgi:hypothetical protein